MAMKLRRLSNALGAEICDIDISKPMSESTFGEIHRVFLDYGILLLRNQNVTREQHIEFSRRFGELDKHDSLPRDRHPDYPELLLVTNRPNPDGTPSESRYTGRQWHTDLSYTTTPALGSLLKCYNLPEVGGDTLFANMTMAYDALSEGMKKLIADLHGIHLSGTRKINTPEAGIARQAEVMKLNPPIAQPVVTRTPGDRAQGALPRRKGQALRRHDRGRKQTADRLSEQARHPARIRLPPPVARARHPGLGQPLHLASGAGRLRRNTAAPHGAHHGYGYAFGSRG